MKANVVKQAGRRCEVQTENGLLVVFSLPEGKDLHLSDSLQLHGLKLNADVTVTNLTKGESFVVRIAEHDVHDLNRGEGHGASRTPSEARLRGE
jgi:hypothetical protein